MTAQRLRVVSITVPQRVGKKARTVRITLRMSARARLVAAGHHFIVRTKATKLTVPLPKKPTVGLLKVPFKVSATNHAVKGTLHGSIWVIRTCGRPGPRSRANEPYVMSRFAGQRRAGTSARLAPVGEHKYLAAVDGDPDAARRLGVVGDADRVNAGGEGLEDVEVRRLELGDRVRVVVDDIQAAPVGSDGQRASLLPGLGGGDDPIPGAQVDLGHLAGRVERRVQIATVWRDDEVPRALPDDERAARASAWRGRSS